MKEFPPSQTPGDWSLDSLEKQIKAHDRRRRISRCSPLKQRTPVQRGCVCHGSRRDLNLLRIHSSQRTGQSMTLLDDSSLDFPPRRSLVSTWLTRRQSRPPIRCRPGMTASAKQAILDFVARSTAGRLPTSSRPRSASPSSTTTARSGASSRCTSNSSSPSTASRRSRRSIPSGRTKEPFASLLKGDLKAALAGGETRLLELVMATHAGMTTEEFEKIVNDWIATAKHPKTGQLYTEMVYQPMLELLAYLRANGFKTFIVSGGGIEFMRPWTGAASTASRPSRSSAPAASLKYELRDGTPVHRQAAGTRLHRRQGGQARRHPAPHRPPPDRRLRQLRRRLRDAANGPPPAAARASA